MSYKMILPVVFFVSILVVPHVCAQDIFDEIRKGHIENVKKLIEEYPQSIHSRYGGIYPLHQAVRHGQREIEEFLIPKGADVNTFGKDITEFAPFEFTPMTEAIRNNDIDMIKIFVAKGADVKKITSLGESYLHFAAFLNRLELAEYFIDLGLDVNIKKNGNMTPPHIAVVVGNREVAELLIRKGADLDLRSTDGGTPLHFAIAAGHQEIAELLSSRNAKDVPRKFPLYKGKYLG